MDIKEIRETLEQLEGGALKHCDNDEDYHKFILADREFRKKSLDYCRFLLSEVEGLQNTIAQMQDVEQTVYECRMKGGDAVRHLLDSLLAENKQLKTEVERLEKENADYHKIISEILKCDPVPACKREDNKLEPPWEVISRIRKENAALRKVVEKARHYLIGPVPINLEEEFARRWSVVAALEKIKED